jgi:membrane-associated phospholipid phosphatase
VLLLAAAAFAVGFVAVFLVGLHTARGLRYDAELYQRASGSRLTSVTTAGERTLATIDVGSLVAGALVLGFLALVRGRVVRAFAAVALVAAAVGSVEVLKHELPRIAGALPAGRPATFPSGHTAIAVSLGLALVLAMPSILRPSASVIGAAYGAAVGFSVIALGWHYPSDVAGSFFVCGFWACVAGALTGGTPRRQALSFPGVLLASGVVSVGLGVAAYVATHHHAAVAEVRTRESLVGTAALLGVLSLLTFAVVAPLLEERRR